jgi:hypothetical protein
VSFVICCPVILTTRNNLYQIKSLSIDMACVTLKRSLELEPLYSPPYQNPSKRRRCTPLTPLFSRRQQSEGSTGRKEKKVVDTEVKRVFASQQQENNAAEPFKFAALPSPSSDELYSRIRDEWKRLKRRRQLKYQKSALKKSSGSASSSDNDESPVVPSSSRGAKTGANDESSALFTLEQVCTICNKLLVERENAVREEYDRALCEKLSEQYDAFVKFTHDQIQSHFSQSTPSYLS